MEKAARGSARWRRLVVDLGVERPVKGHGCVIHLTFIFPPKEDRKGEKREK
jgi:hypothetical protein